MKAIVAAEAGPPRVLQIADVDVPPIGEREALIAVEVAGVNFADIVMRRGGLGQVFPFTPGVEGAGVVRAVGELVDEVAVGDRVVYGPVAQSSAVGSYAECQAVPVDQLVPVPDHVALRDAASLLVQGFTAHYLVHDQCLISPGTFVLVHAAAGGTGLIVTRWLAHLGAVVIGTVSSDAKAAAALAAGAAHTIRYDQVDFVAECKRLTEGRGVDYVVDGVGGARFAGNVAAVRTRGHICLFGRADGFPAPIQPFAFVPKSITLSGGYMVNFLRNRAEVVSKAAELWRGLTDGWLVPPFVQESPLAHAAAAHQDIEDRTSVGKHLLIVG